MDKEWKYSLNFKEGIGWSAPLLVGLVALCVIYPQCIYSYMIFLLELDVCQYHDNWTLNLHHTAGMDPLEQEYMLAVNVKTISDNMYDWVSRWPFNKQ